MKRVVVLGATGAAGQTICDELERRSIGARAVSRSISNLDRVFLGRSIELRAADLTRESEALAALEDCDRAILAVGVAPAQYRRHIDVAQAVARASRELGVHVVLVTSYWSYTPIGDNPVREDHPREPTSDFGQVRRELEDVLLEAGACVAHFPDFYGLGLGPRTSFLNEALSALVRGRSVSYLGNPDAARDFIFVPDIGPVAVDLAFCDVAFGARVNVPGSGPATPRELIEQAAAMLGKPVRVRRIPRALVSGLALFSNDMRALRSILPIYEQPVWMNGDRLGHLLGSFEMTGYDRGLRATIDGYLRSPG